MKRYATIAALLVTTALPLASAASAAPQPPDQYNGPYMGQRYVDAPAYRAYGYQNRGAIAFRGNDGQTWHCVNGFDSGVTSAYPSWEICR